MFTRRAAVVPFLMMLIDEQVNDKTKTWRSATASGVLPPQVPASLMVAAIRHVPTAHIPIIATRIGLDGIAHNRSCRQRIF